MNAEELTREAFWIDNEGGWPLWPVLPLKNIYRGDPNFKGPDHGMIIASPGNPDRADNPPRTLFFMNIFDLKAGALEPQLVNVPSVSFESTAAMVAAGWIGD